MGWKEDRKIEGTGGDGQTLTMVGGQRFSIYVDGAADLQRREHRPGLPSGSQANWQTVKAYTEETSEAGLEPAGAEYRVQGAGNYILTRGTSPS